MNLVARPFSISLAPAHEQQIAIIEEKIRSKAQKSHTNRSEAVQIALHFLSTNSEAPVADLVRENEKIDNRRKKK